MYENLLSQVPIRAEAILYFLANFQSRGIIAVYSMPTMPIGMMLAMDGSFEIATLIPAHITFEQHWTTTGSAKKLSIMLHNQSTAVATQQPL